MSCRDLSAEFAHGFAPPCGGEMGGDDAVAARQKCTDQRRGRAHFAQADGVHPDGACQRGLGVAEAFGYVLGIERVAASALAQVEPDQRDEDEPEALVGPKCHA